jgi:hypothetical protein
VAEDEVAALGGLDEVAAGFGVVGETEGALEFVVEFFGGPRGNAAGVVVGEDRPGFVGGESKAVEEGDGYGEGLGVSVFAGDGWGDFLDVTPGSGGGELVDGGLLGGGELDAGLLLAGGELSGGGILGFSGEGFVCRKEVGGLGVRSAGLFGASGIGGRCFGFAGREYFRCVGSRCSRLLILRPRDRPAGFRWRLDFGVRGEEHFFGRGRHQESCFSVN